MNDLLSFKRNAMMLGLCTSYKNKWDEATSKEALMEIATDAKGMDMIADSISNGWGLSSSYIAKNFFRLHKREVAEKQGWLHIRDVCFPQREC